MTRYEHAHALLDDFILDWASKGGSEPITQKVDLESGSSIEITLKVHATQESLDEVHDMAERMKARLNN